MTILNKKIKKNCHKIKGSVSNGVDEKNQINFYVVPDK